MTAKQRYCLDHLRRFGPASTWDVCKRGIADGTIKVRCRYEWADAPFRELREKGLIEKTGARDGMGRAIHQVTERGATI